MNISFAFSWSSSSDKRCKILRLGRMPKVMCDVYHIIDPSITLQCKWSLEVLKSTHMEQRDKSTWNFAKGTDKSSLFDDSQTRADSLMFQSAKVSLYYACKFHQARLYPEYKVSPRLPFTLVLLPMIMQGNTKKIRKNTENGKPNYSDPIHLLYKRIILAKVKQFYHAKRNSGRPHICH